MESCWATLTISYCIEHSDTITEADANFGNKISAEFTPPFGTTPN